MAVDIETLVAWRQTLSQDPDNQEVRTQLQQLLTESLMQVGEPARIIGICLLILCEIETGHRVQSGVFKGLQLHQSAFYWKLPMLLGTYEMELVPWIHEAMRTDYTAVINIGCGEGYYIAGMARQMSATTRFYAFDTSQEAQALCRETARINNVSERITTGGYCSPQMLQELVQNQRALVLIDCEGCEYDMLDPSLVPGLVNSDLIIECHDHQQPHQHITATLTNRFAATHRVESVRAGARDPNTMPLMDSMHDVLRWLSVCEFRGSVQNWLRLRTQQ
ncbi:MAG: hypothetical protein HQL58_04815 [Magnetococcales bacterium]|nr:hypothetical protein [Magnetococcales bacterium]